MLIGLVILGIGLIAGISYATYSKAKDLKQDMLENWDKERWH
jgi:hypothetical protein